MSQLPLLLYKGVQRENGQEVYTSMNVVIFIGPETYVADFLSHGSQSYKTQI